jgi:hypothetical protein
MSPWEKLLEHAHSHGHFVQLYSTDESSLAKNVALYLYEGLKRGDGVLVIATPEHRDMFCRRLEVLGFDTQLCVREQQLVFCDAHETLSQFMKRGQPDWRLFEAAIKAAIRRVRPRPECGLRAYGEMVGMLWNVRQFAAALRLEQLWNKLLTQSAFSLYCAYSIDIFGKETHTDALDALLRTHTHLIPTERRGGLEKALNLAMDEVFGPKAGDYRLLIRTDHGSSMAVMPDAEAAVLWLRKNVSGQADDVIARAQRHYQTAVPAAGPN